jgi:hypothetical protein
VTPDTARRAALISRFKIPRIAWRDLAVTLGPFALLLAAAFWFAFRFINPAPPDTIVMTSGPQGSMFQMSAERYRKILERQGVTLRILPSQGSLENLKRLSDPAFNADIGFVQGGISSLGEPGKLMSLGSVFYVPVLVRNQLAQAGSSDRKPA